MRTNDSKNQNVQVLRFVAAALVLVTHITYYLHERIEPSVTVWHVGESGVPLFFVISGFVMYLSGRRLEGVPMGARIFLQRRLARIIPIYWLITTLKVAAALAVPAVILHNKPDLWRVIASYLMFPAFNADGDVRPLHGVGWTLLHEMMFYYLFALALFVRRSPIIWCSLCIGVLWLVGTFYMPHAAPAKVYLSQINLLFVVGMLLSLLSIKNISAPVWLAWLVLLFGGATIAFPELNSVRRPLGGDFDFGAVMVFWSFLHVRVSEVAGVRRALVRLGDSSYSLYLIHPFVAPAVCVALDKLGVRQMFIIGVCAFFASVFVGYLLCVFVENRLFVWANERLGKLFCSSRNSAVGQSS